MDKDLFWRKGHKYLDDPTICPYCGNSTIGQIESVDDLYEECHHIKCCHCKKEWSEIFVLAAVEFRDGDETFLVKK